MNASEKIRVLGIGAAGVRMLECVQALGLPNVLAVGIDTDTRSLEAANVAKKLPMKTAENRGLGAGGMTKSAKDAAMQYIQYLAKAARHTRVLVLLGGLGGGTASIVAPILAKLADAGTTIISVFALPFEFEGDGKRALAQKSFDFLKSKSSMSVALKNDILISGSGASAEEAYKAANKQVARLVEMLACGFSDAAFLKIDEAQLQSFFAKKTVCAGTAQTEFGDAAAAFDEIKKSPMMSGDLVSSNVLVCIKCPKSFSMDAIKGVLKAAGSAFGTARKISFSVCAEENCEEVKILAAAAPVEDGDEIFAAPAALENAPRPAPVAAPTPRTIPPQPAAFANTAPQPAAPEQAARPAPELQPPPESNPEPEPAAAPVEFKPEPAPDSKKQPAKEQLQFTFDERGLFENTPRNERKNVDVDIPTFLRKRIKITIL